MSTNFERLAAEGRRRGDKPISKLTADELSEFRAEAARVFSAAMEALGAEFERRGFEADDGTIDWQKVEAYADRNLGGADRWGSLPISEALLRIDLYNDEKQAELRQIARYMVEESCKRRSRSADPQVARIRAAAAKAYKAVDRSIPNGAANRVAGACHLLDLDREEIPRAWLKWLKNRRTWKAALEANPNTVRKWFSTNARSK